MFVLAGVAVTALAPAPPLALATSQPDLILAHSQTRALGFILSLFQDF